MISKTITNVWESISAAAIGAKGSLQHLALMISRKKYLQKEFQKYLPLLSQMQGKQVNGVIGLVGVFRVKQILLKLL